MKESPVSNYPKLIFRETFRDEATVRKNGGVPTAVTFRNGVASFNGTSSKINYNLNLNGTYSVRIRLKSLTPTVGLFFYDYRGTAGTGVGYLFINTGTVLSGKTGGTVYVNSVATTTVSSSTKEIIVSGTTFTPQDNIFRLGTRYAENLSLNGEIDLVEIYQGTLTPSEVKNLYNNKWNKEFSSPNTLLDFDSTRGVVKDRTGKNPLIPTDVSIKKIGQNYSADFNGTTSIINTGSDFIGTKAVTVCGWIKLTGFGELGLGRIIDNKKFIFTLNGSDKKIGLSSDFTVVSFSAVNSIKLNTWQFVSATRTAGGITNIYIGDLSNAPALSGAANQLSGTPVAGISNIIIGNSSTQHRTFDGNIPMLKVYEGILDIDTITQIWSETRKEIG